MDLHWPGVLIVEMKAPTFDLEKARAFYGDTLGIEVELGEMGLLTLRLGGDRPTLVYPKPDFELATYTILNFPVDDIDAAVEGIAVAGYFIAQELRKDAAQDAAAEQPIEGVEEYGDLTNNHVEGEVEYAQNPPVGGDHNAVWQNCGVYSQPVAAINAVHSLEHGAVWITYDPSLAADQVELITAQAASNNYVLVSPQEDLPTPVVASA